MHNRVIIPLLCVHLLLVTGLSGNGLPRPVAKLAPETRSLRDALFAERGNAGLSALDYDSTYSGALERRLPAILRTEEGSAGRAVSVINLDQHIYDWNKKCFLCRCQASEEVEERLLRDSLFITELRKPEITHLIASAVTLGDSVAAIACLVQRAVQFGACEETLTDFGKGSLTLSGYALGCDWLRFVLYRGAELPEDYAGTELISRAVSPDVSGYFEVTLPTGRFGTGDFRIAVYAKSEGSDEFHLAALIPRKSRQPAEGS
jgi:hypothetical protein